MNNLQMLKGLKTLQHVFLQFHKFEKKERRPGAVKLKIRKKFKTSDHSTWRSIYLTFYSVPL